MLRADPIRQGRRARRPDAADLARLGDRPRHQGRELDVDRRLARQVRPRAAVRSDQRGKRQPTIPCWRSAAANGRFATSRTSPTFWSIPRARWSAGTTGRRPAIRCWSAPSCTCSTRSRTRRSPASPTSSPIRAGRSRRRCAAMMTTPHLGERGVHPVVASSARELLNKSDNERSGVLSTAMSFLGLYRDPVVATVTRQMRLAHPRSGGGSDAGDALPGRAAVRHQPHQTARAPDPQPDRPATDRGAGSQAATASLAADARRIPGARPARFLRERARLHGGLWPEELPDRPVAEPDREGLRPEQLDPRQLPCARELRDQRRAHGQARVSTPSARRQKCAR